MENNNKDLEQVIKPITLEMKRGTWELFKNITPRKLSLNEAIRQLIMKEIIANCEDLNPEEVENFLDKKE